MHKDKDTRESTYGLDSTVCIHQYLVMIVGARTGYDNNDQRKSIIWTWPTTYLCPNTRKMISIIIIRLRKLLRCFGSPFVLLKVCIFCFKSNVYMLELLFVYMQPKRLVPCPWWHLLNLKGDKANKMRFYQVLFYSILI